MSFKREYKRAKVNLEAKYIVKILPNFSRDILIRDISAGGLCFEAEDLLESKAVVIITVYLKDADEEIRLEGEVMWSRFDASSGKNLNGIQFTEVTTPDFQTFLSFYCKQILNL